MEQDTILAMYSGGLDSLGMLYSLLTEPQYQDYTIHVHHIHNRNIERRDLAEALITGEALAKLRNMGFDFVYSESGISSPIYGKTFMYDTDSINFFAGFVCLANPSIKKIAMGRTSSDLSDPFTLSRIERATKILEAFTDAEKLYPVFHKTKLEIYLDLPEELKNKFWSCRTPKFKNGKMLPCGCCHTCNQFTSFGIPHIELNW